MRIHGTGISPDDLSLPEPVRKRWKILDVRAEEKGGKIHDAIGHERLKAIGARLSALATDSHTPSRLRLRDLYRVANEFTRHAEGFVACKRGCAHCCHGGVPITPMEADLMSADLRIKRKRVPLRDPQGAVTYAEAFSYGYTRPCTFLVNGECSIYEHRPLTCRIHYNVDDDEMLCRLDYPGPVPVPYLNVMPFRATYLAIGGLKVADVREFFPQGKI